MDKHDLINHLSSELEKVFPAKEDMTDDEEETYNDDIRTRAWAFYNMVDDPSQWKLEEIIDAITLERKWMWRRKA